MYGPYVFVLSATLRLCNVVPSYIFVGGLFFLFGFVLIHFTYSLLWQIDLRSEALLFPSHV